MKRKREREKKLESISEVHVRPIMESIGGNKKKRRRTEKTGRREEQRNNSKRKRGWKKS